MRASAFFTHVLGAAAAAVLLASCASATQTGTSGFAPAAPQARHATNYRPMISRDGVMSALPAGFKPNAHRPAWMKAAPDSGNVRPGLAVAQFGGDSVLWFPKSISQEQTAGHLRTGVIDQRHPGRQRRESLDSRRARRLDHRVRAQLRRRDARRFPIRPANRPTSRSIASATSTFSTSTTRAVRPPSASYKPTGKQIRTLSDPSFAVLFGVGTDRHGNVFVSNLTSGNVGNVVEFTKGKMPGKALSGISLGLPGTPALDSKGNLIISDWLNGTIDVFAPPYSGAPHNVRRSWVRRFGAR